MQPMHAYAPSEIHAIFERAFNAGDLGAILALYEPDAVYVTGGHPVAGLGDIGGAYRAILAEGVPMKLVTRAVVDCGELAVVYGTWSHGELEGISTEAVRRQPDGTWKFVIDNPCTPR